MIFVYTNDIGARKKLAVEKQDDGQYKFVIQRMDIGDICGMGTFAKEELIEFLNHYNIPIPEELEG